MLPTPANQYSSAYIHVLLYNTPFEQARLCIDALILSEGIPNIRIVVSDNSPSSDVIDRIKSEFGGRVLCYFHGGKNLGFSGGHNFAAARFLESDSASFIVLNPDVRVQPDTLCKLIHISKSKSGIGLVTPLLLRCDEQLQPIAPPVVDAAGMIINPSLRHFDRFSGRPLNSCQLFSGAVFGGTGACLLIAREAVKDLLLKGEMQDSKLFDVYPSLSEHYDDRAPLFDEAFFAYREDADLAWRAQIFGWKCWFCADAVAFHRRVVVPERRSALSAELNSLGVRNRFLLQLNNFWFVDLSSIFWGLILRNILVIAAVLFKEKTSRKAFCELCKLYRRAIERRRIIKQRKRINVTDLKMLFTAQLGV